jgi:hypothetical protein
MDNLIGKITASLVDKEQSFPEGLIEKINKNVKPPEKIVPDDINIRAMYLLSDQVNSYGGRFPVDEHDKIIELLIDCPVLIGHRKDSLPIARTFHAEKERRNNRNWVKVYFYWLKNSRKGEDLRKNIDGGIYKECSISFIFRFPECGICGSDIRNCRHRPFTKYDSSEGGKKEAYFNYRQIDKVLEVSLVYRGSVHETSITGALFTPLKETLHESSDENTFKRPTRYRIWDLKQLDPAKDYYVMPAYESLSVFLEKTNNGAKLLSPNCGQIENRLLSEHLKEMSLPDGDYILDCRLVGYRGKSRQPVSELLSFLKGGKSTVRRMELIVYDIVRCDDAIMIDTDGASRRSKLEELFQNNRKALIPASIVNGKDITEVLNKRGTRCGIEIYDSDSPIRYLFTHRKLVPLLVSKKEKNADNVRYRLHGLSGGEHLRVAIQVASKYDLNEGDVVEVEVYSLHRAGDIIELIHPRIIDCRSEFSDDTDITYLLKTNSTGSSSPEYVVYETNDKGIILQICDDDPGCYLLRNFSPKLIDNGRKLLADTLEMNDVKRSTVCGSGSIIAKENIGECTRYHLKGFFNGKFAFRSAILNGQTRRLFYRFDSNNSSGVPV